MVFSIVFSDRASDELTSVLKYIEDQWSLRISNEFTKLFNEKIVSIQSNPFLYPSFRNKKNVRRCVISKQVSLYYRIKSDEVQIITLFDNRRDPDNLKF